jgi:hypothetical protein
MSARRGAIRIVGVAGGVFALAFFAGTGLASATTWQDCERDGGVVTTEIPPHTYIPPHSNIDPSWHPSHERVCTCYGGFFNNTRVYGPTPHTWGGEPLYCIF